MKLEERTAYTFPHAREALRCWATHRRGPGLAVLGRNGPRGHAPGIDEALAVGRVLTLMGLRLDPPCDRLRQLLLWALGSLPRSEIESLAKRVERAMRAAAIVAPPTRILPAWRDRWVDASDVVHETSALLESVGPRSA